MGELSEGHLSCDEHSANSLNLPRSGATANAESWRVDVVEVVVDIAFAAMEAEGVTGIAWIA